VLRHLVRDTPLCAPLTTAVDCYIGTAVKFHENLASVKFSQNLLLKLPLKISWHLYVVIYDIDMEP